MGQIEKAPKKAAPAKPAAASKGKAAPAAAQVPEEPEEDPVQTALARYGIIMSMPWEPKKMCALNLSWKLLCTLPAAFLWSQTPALAARCIWPPVLSDAAGDSVSWHLMQLETMSDARPLSHMACVHVPSRGRKGWRAGW